MWVHQDSSDIQRYSKNRLEMNLQAKSEEAHQRRHISSNRLFENTHFNTISYTCKVIKPSYALITNKWITINIYILILIHNFKL